MLMRIFVGISALILTSNVFADVKNVSVPFVHLAVPLEGMNINYNLNGKYPQKVVCILDHFYKGHLKYVENGTQKEALPFGDGDDATEVYFTNKGPTWEKTQGLDSLEQFHVDAKSYIMLKNTYYSAPIPYATCFYMPENA